MGLTVDAEASDEEAAAADAFLEYLQTDDAMKYLKSMGLPHIKQMIRKKKLQKMQRKTKPKK